MKCSPLFEIRETQGTSTNPKRVQQPWPSNPDSNESAISNYPSLYTSDGSSSSAQVGQIIMSASDGFDHGYGFPIQSVGTDTSPGNSNQEGSSSRPHSNHPTPSTLSNQQSSHTSYTPPQNQSSGSGTTNSGAQSQASPNFTFSSSNAWSINMQNQLGQGVSDQPQNSNFASTGMTPGPTGMTPVPDTLWPAEGLADNEWMFGWPGATPQP